MPIGPRSMPASAGWEVPLAVPSLGGNASAYVQECLDTNFVSSVGPFVNRLERMVAERVVAAHAVATASGTAALHVALLVAGVRPDEEVVISTLSFIAPANTIRYAQAWPVFMDADSTSWQMDPQKLREFLTRQCRWRDGALWNQATGRRVRAILPVHILGHPCDMDPILQLAREYELVVIEDATESLGAIYKGTPVGHLGDIACFSFNGNKIVTAGGGGMMVTDRAAWAERAKYLTTQARDDADAFIHHEVGYNYRLTNLQAALGCAQMEQLDAHVAAKRRIAQAYADAFAQMPGLVRMSEAPWARSIWWIYTVLVDEERFGMSAQAVRASLRERGIEAQPLWHPLHQNAAHADAQAYRCDIAPQLVRRSVRLPSSVGLAAEQQASVIRHFEGIGAGSSGQPQAAARQA